MSSLDYRNPNARENLMPFVAQDSVQCVVGIQLIFVEKTKHPRDLTIDSGNKSMF